VRILQWGYYLKDVYSITTAISAFATPGLINDQDELLGMGLLICASTVCKSSHASKYVFSNRSYSADLI
jgi:hypothetical protein